MLLHGARFEQPRIIAVRLFGAREEDQAAGVAVQPVHHEDLAEALVQQAYQVLFLGQVPAGGHGQHPGVLVYHQQVRRLAYHFEGGRHAA